MTDPVFIAAAAASAMPGDTIVVEGPEGRHAASAQRLRPGDPITVVDGEGAWASGVVGAAGPDRVDVTVQRIGRDADPRVVLVQALAKGGRDEQAVEAATELGVCAVVPWQSDRSISRWRGPKLDKGRHKWATLATAAAKQSRRALVPEVREPVDTRALAAEVARATAEGARVVLLHEESAVPISEYSWQGFDGEVWFIVGPEGGMTEAEVRALREAGAVPALLGPHVLRASSAGPAAIAACGALAGWWSQAPGHRGGERRAIR